MTDYQLQLTFVSDTNEEIRVNIPSASATLDTATTQSLMEDMIDTNIIQTKNGEPRSAKGAVRVKTVTTDINLE